MQVEKLKTVDADTLLSTPLRKTLFVVEGLIPQGLSVLYLCLEDTHIRIQNRLYQLTDEALQSFELPLLAIKSETVWSSRSKRI